MSNIGIMQGRLTSPSDDRMQFFPRNNWPNEFALAAQAGFDCIEWLYDLQDMNMNPLSTDAGIQAIRTVSAQQGIKVSSVCAHYFIEKPFVGAGDQELENGFAVLSWLLQRCGLLDIKRLVLPMEDAALLNNEHAFDYSIAFMWKVMRVAERSNMEIDLETTLPPERLSLFLDNIEHPLLKINYDCGNSAGLGYRIQDEFDAYGQRIGSIHIKDKSAGGNTVELGKGAVDFHALSSCLQKISYSGDFILEAARGKPGNELDWAGHNRDFVVEFISKKLSDSK